MADVSSRAGERYATPQILEFAAQTHHPHDSSLERAYEAPRRHGLPEIQVSPSEGRLLELLLRLAGARKVVEVGTLTGYSALWILQALPADGHLWTLEADSRHAEVATAVFRDAGVDDRVTVVVGDALDSLPQLNDYGPFCAVFLDADKRRYDAYGRWATDHLREGGLLIGDNAYLFGHLLDDDEAARAMRRFHESMSNRFRSVCIPTPDGLAVGVRASSSA